MFALFASRLSGKHSELEGKLFLDGKIYLDLSSGLIVRMGDLIIAG
jgi:hypothetical protein